MTDANHPGRGPILIDTPELALAGGLKVAVKDCLDVCGYPTRLGSGALLDQAPALAHAEVVANVLAGGGSVAGKTHMHELAYGVTGINAAFGTPTNPLYPELIPGGSSSGSAAAVAARLADVAIGTDTGGSIRLPATCCGVFGLKPTFGRVSRVGCHPAQSSLDCVGPLARDVAGLEAAMRLLDPSFSPAQGSGGLCLGRVVVDAEPEVEASVDAVLAHAPARLVSINLPLLEEAFAAGVTIMAAECWSAFGALVGDARMGEDVRARLLAASAVTPDQVAQAEQVRSAFTLAVDRALVAVDALVLPTLPSLPPALDELGDAARTLRLTALVRPFNLSGHPALTMPLERKGARPVGLQLIGRRGQDEALCAVARVLAEEGS
jgi:amidase